MKARASGADEFLGKTLHHTELVSKVRDWLASRSLPGGVGEPEFLELAIDLVELLQVELIWLLGVRKDGLESLAVASERGEQEALRFVETVGRNPIPLDQPSPFAAALQQLHPNYQCLIEDLNAQDNGKNIASAMKNIGASAVSIIPLSGPQDQRGLLVFPLPPTLELEP